MAWVKLDDAMPTHPKLMAAGPVAFALDVAGICYSNKHATDGFIATFALPAILPGLPSPKKVAAKLVEVGRWVETADGWQIHDVHDYQPSAEHQKEVSKKRAEAGRKGGSKSSRSSQANGKQNAKQLASVPDNPVPSRPVPTPEVPKSVAASRLPPDWEPAPEPELIAAVGTDRAVVELAKFRDYWPAQPGAKARKADWQATWRNWLRRAAENQGARAGPKGPTRPPEGDVDYRAGWDQETTA